jgi:Rad52/22 family double-strand break repair protein
VSALHVASCSPTMSPAGQAPPSGALDGHPRTALPPDVVAALLEPFPEEAISFHEHTSLASIGTMYVVERLNEVFGLDGWTAAYELVEAEEMVVVKCCLTVKAYGLMREQFGGNSNYDRGDAYKSACSDALGKCASQLGIGSYVYKGLVRPRARETTTPGSSTNLADARAPEHPERPRSRNGTTDPKSRNHLYWFEEMKRVLGAHPCEEVFRERGIRDASEIRHLAEARDLFRQLVTIFDRQYLEVRSNLPDGEYKAVLETLKYQPDPPDLSLTQRLKIYELMKKAASGGK